MKKRILVAIARWLLCRAGQVQPIPGIPCYVWPVTGKGGIDMIYATEQPALELIELRKLQTGEVKKTGSWMVLW